MIPKEISQTLEQISQKYGDRRLHVCKITIASLENGLCRLSGTVLDAETKTAVTTALAADHPQIQFDAGDIRLLRADPPRFMTLTTNLAGLHCSPSRTSALDSQVVNGAAMEYLDQVGDWIFIRQRDGYLGWLHKPYLEAGDLAVQPTHLVAAPVAFLYPAADADQPILTRIFAGTAVQVLQEATDWARIHLAGKRTGWVTTAALRDLANLPQDVAGRRGQMVGDSRLYTGVPYLWGGCSVQGIDCSGFVQLLHKLAGVAIPRDADMQFAAGEPVDPPFQPGDLLFFGGAGGHRAITHVGLSLGGWRIVHASGPRNGVYEDDVQAVSWLGDRFVGARTFLNV